jgi:hypothetical protein
MEIFLNIEEIILYPMEFAMRVLVGYLSFSSRRHGDAMSLSDLSRRSLGEGGFIARVTEL